MPASGAQRAAWIEVGRVARARGLAGEVSVALHGDDPSNLLAAARVRLEGAPGRIPFSVRGARLEGGGRVRLALAGLDERAAIEPWVGAAVAIEGHALADLPEGEFYWRDLIGLSVVDADGQPLGPLQEIWPTPGHDVLVVAHPDGPWLLPAVDEVLLDVDLEAGRIRVAPPPGSAPQGPGGSP